MADNSASNASDCRGGSKADGLLFDEKCGMGVAIAPEQGRIWYSRFCRTETVRFFMFEEVAMLCAVGVVSLVAIG